MFLRTASALLFLGLMCCIHCSGQRVDIRQFGSVGSGSDDSATVKRALSTVRGGVLLLPAGLIIHATNYFEVPSGVSLEGGAQLEGVKFHIGSNTSISGLTFQGASAGIYIDPSSTRSGDTIANNTFIGVDMAIHIAATTKGESAHDLAVTGNSCQSCGQFVFAEKVNNSKFANNMVQVKERGLIFFSGARNQIINNRIDGGITGISFVFQFATAGEDGVVSNNVIENNQISNVSEESISFDIRGNEPALMAVREVDTVASKNGSSVTLSASAWGGVGSALHQLYLCWMSGALDGTCLRSAGGSASTFRLEATEQQFHQINPADQVVVGAPFLYNAVYHNTIQINPANKQASGILFWGFAYDNVACGNVVTSLTPAPNISGIGVMSLNGLVQRGGVTAAAGGRKAPSENNLVANNQILNLRLQVGYQDWGHQVHYPSKGNVLFRNTVEGGVVDVKDQRPTGIAGDEPSKAVKPALPLALKETIMATGGSTICGSR